MKIPIKNIYYLLCYAWNQLQERDIVRVKADDFTSLLDLFARVLISGTTHILKRGLDRGYITYSEAIRGIKGKIDFNTTLKKQLLKNSRIQCEYDELRHNVLHNRILKSTIRSLIIQDEIDRALHNELLLLYRMLNEIEEIKLSPNIFSRVQLNKNNYFYSFLINICEMIYNIYLVSEGDGESKFRDFLRDRMAMAKLFEEFVKNFYKKELPNIDYKVGSKKIKWIATANDDESMKYLPAMKTDISIKTPQKYIIIDTKYYENALQTYREKDTIHSTNLYQLFAYIKNIECDEDERYKSCEGILLYPTTGYDLKDKLSYEIQGHKILIRTINLANEWQDIHRYLLRLIGIETDTIYFSKSLFSEGFAVSQKIVEALFEIPPSPGEKRLVTIRFEKQNFNAELVRDAVSNYKIVYTENSPIAGFFRKILSPMPEKEAKIFLLLVENDYFRLAVIQ